MNVKNSKSMRRKLKYGAVAAALTCVVLVLVIVLNSVFQVLADKYSLYVDMTKAQMFGISEATTKVLDEYADTSAEVKIIFCMPEDKLESDLSYYYVLNCARKYAERYDFVSIEYRDIALHPNSVKEFLSTTVTTINTTSVIITNGSASRVLSMNLFYTYSSETNEVFAFDGEYKFTSTILQLIGDHPIAYFTSGHGEDASSSVMYSLFEEAGFDVREIDLTKEEIDPSARVVVINNPKFDFMGISDSTNEIAKIDKFLDDRGNLMVFADASRRELPELEELLSEWGIKLENSIIRDYDNSLSVDGTELVATYVEEGTGASLTRSLRALPSVPKAIVNYARPISLLWESKGNRGTTTVLTTSPSAEAFDGETSDSGVRGTYNLMTLSFELNVVNDEEVMNYVLVAGTSSFADDKYIGRESYGNRDIIFNAMKNFGKKAVPVDIDFKVFDDESLDITTKQANILTGVFTAVLPCVVVVAAVIVFARRRRL